MVAASLSFLPLRVKAIFLEVCVHDGKAQVKASCSVW